MAENGGSFSDEIPISFRSMSLQYFEFSKNDFIPASKQEFVYFFSTCYLFDAMFNFGLIQSVKWRLAPFKSSTLLK